MALLSRGLKPALRSACLAMLLAGFGLPVVQAASPAVSERAVKAALLVKLTRFVYLPEQAVETPPVICLLGQNPFDNHLQTLTSALPDDKQVQVQLLNATQQAADCQLVYIAKSETRRLDAHLQALKPYPLVTISDIDGFARKGGMVELALDNSGQINILINRSAATQQGADFSAQLLRLATIVTP